MPDILLRDAYEPLLVAVAAVLSNWHNVMRAINMASSEFNQAEVQLNVKSKLINFAAKIPKPGAPEGDEERAEKRGDSEVPLPQTLVRIPVESEEQPEEAQHDASKER